MAGLGALAELDLNEFDLRVGGVGLELFGVEGTVVVAAAKVARGHFPDQVATVLAVVHRDGAFARVVGKAAALGARVERLDGVGAQGPKAHGRDVEHARAVRLRGVGPDGDAKVVAGHGAGCDRMRHPLVPFGIGVTLRAKRVLVRIALGALVDERALRPRERRSLVVALNKVLANLGPDEFEHEAQVPNDGVVAQNRALGLQQVVHAHTAQVAKNQHWQQVAAIGPQHRAEQKSQHDQRKRQIAHGVHKMQQLQHGLFLFVIRGW